MPPCGDGDQTPPQKRWQRRVKFRARSSSLDSHDACVRLRAGVHGDPEKVLDALDPDVPVEVPLVPGATDGNAGVRGTQVISPARAPGVEPWTC
jgi:hypothetical protein